MNILIVGNGFDLSHYLPTKYDHFMVAMKAIEDWDESKSDIVFDDLFESLYEKEKYFFSCTKAMYKTDEVRVSVNEVKELKERLKKNAWYRFFLDYKKNNIDSWIDFENKINEALLIVKDLIVQYDLMYNTDSTKLNLIGTSPLTNTNYKYIMSLIQEKIIVLSLLGVVSESETVISNNSYSFPEQVRGKSNYKIAENFLKLGKKRTYDLDVIESLNIDKIFDFLNKDLEDISSIFSTYLNFLDKLIINKSLKIPYENFDKISKMYSFNYTKTYDKLYNKKIDIDFLHGNFDKNNIIFGISDLDENLKKYKPYYFVKYYQKIIKNTDYLFLSANNEIRNFLSRLKPQFSTRINDAEFKDKVINLYIWGHSLDYSDKNYVQEIFNLKSDNNMYLEVDINIIIFYFNENARYLILANLFNILGQTIVEERIKNSSLKFLLNPDIATINKLEAQNLPKSNSYKEVS